MALIPHPSVSTSFPYDDPFKGVRDRLLLGVDEAEPGDEGGGVDSELVRTRLVSMPLFLNMEKTPLMRAEGPDSNGWVIMAYHVVDYI